MGKKLREKRARQLSGSTEDALVPKREVQDRFPILKLFIMGGAIFAMFAPLLVAGGCFFPFVGAKSIYFMAFCEVIFFSWLALIIFNKKYRPKKNIILIALGLLLASMAISTFWGVDPSRSFWSKHERMTGLLMWLHLFGFFLAASSVFGKKDWLKVFFSSNIVAMIVSFTALFLRDKASRGGGTLGNDSFLGTYLLFNIFIAFYLFFSGLKQEEKLFGFVNKKSIKIFAAASFFLLSFCLLFEGTQFWNNFIAGKSALISLPDLLKDIMASGARAAKYSFLGGLALLAPLYFAFTQKGKKRIAGIATLSVLILGSLFLFYLALQPGNFVNQKFVQMASNSRIVIWQHSFDAFKEKPWFGWGPENFEIAFSSHFDPRLFMPEYGREVWFDRAHNIVMDNLVSLGLIGSFLYLAVFAAVFWVLWRLYFLKKANFLEAAIPSVVLIAYFVQNLTVFDMVSSLMMFFVILGFAASLEREAEGNNTAMFEPNQKTSPVKLLMAAAILLVFIFSFSNFIAKTLKNGYLTVQAVNTEDSDERISLYWQALDISPVGRYQAAEFFTEWFSNFSLSSNSATIPTSQIQKEFMAVSGHIKKNIEESPLDYRAYLKLGQLYNAWSRIDQRQIENAQAALEKAISLNADNQQAYWSLAQTKLIQGKSNEAVALADLAIKIEPRVENSHLMVLRIAKIANDNDLFEQRKKEALEINPQWQQDIEAAFK